MSRPLEGPIVKRIQAYLNSQPHCKAIKIHGSQFMEAGTPDVLACLRGRMLALEVKRDEHEKPDPIQLVRLQQWADAGAITAVVWSLDQVRRLVEE